MKKNLISYLVSLKTKTWQGNDNNNIDNFTKNFIYLVKHVQVLSFLLSLTFCVSKMAKIGVYAILVGCLFVNGLFTQDQPSYFCNADVQTIDNFFNVSIGFALLFLPLIGLVADVYFTRYRMIQASFALSQYFDPLLDCCGCCRHCRLSAVV